MTISNLLRFAMTGSVTPKAMTAQPQGFSRRACGSCHKKKTRCDRRLPICGLCNRTSSLCEFPSKRKRSSASLKPRTKSPIRAFNDDVDWLFPLLDQENNSLAGLSVDRTSPNLAEIFTLYDTVDYTDLERQHNMNPTHQQGELSSCAGLVGYTNSELGFENALPQPPSTCATSSDSESSRMDGPQNHALPNPMFTELMELFFDHVQPWLPILHKTRFLCRYHAHLSNDDPFKDLASDEAFLLSTAFALAAGYSSRDSLVEIPAVKRGHKFFETAGDYLSKCRTLTSPTLAYLQGAIMYAFYYYNHGNFLQGWLHTGICVQLAYELGLENMDGEDHSASQGMTWSEKEEMRRAWWLVWELDTFGSIVSSRPVMIDCMRMSVFLPVSDEQWFSDVEVPSARLLSDPGTCWKSLDRTENQCARAWFIVANHLMSHVQSFRQRRSGISPEMRIRLENDISCMRLALPPSMSLETDRTSSNPASMKDMNWIIGTHLMLVSASWYMLGIGARTSGASVSPKSYAFDKARILSTWKPEQIATAHPFYTFLLVNPFSDHYEAHAKDAISLASCRDLSRLLLRQFASKWTIGLIALRVDDICEHEDASIIPTEESVRRYLTCFVTPASGLSPKLSVSTSVVASDIL